MRTDIPKYCVYRDGELAAERADIRDLWTDDMVGFLLGCSFSWEDVLTRQGSCGIRCGIRPCTPTPIRTGGLQPRQITEQKNVPMFRSNIKNVRGGRFEGDLVVSMRPYAPQDAERAAAVTSCYPGAHGGPMHWGDAEAIGVDSGGRACDRSRCLTHSPTLHPDPCT